MRQPIEEEAIHNNHRHIWNAWHEASISRNQDALLSLYSEEAILESPMIPTVLDQESGVIQGRENIRKFLNEAQRRRSASGESRTPMRWWRESRFFSHDDTLIWEYPRETPDDDQIDIVEVMRTQHGLIQHHRVYWGWKLLQPHAHEKTRSTNTET